jgi:hypothetical protein
MATNEMTCDAAADNGRGLHYRSAAWAALAEAADWTGMWPAIDRDGKLTGQAVDSDETAVGWLNVDDEAMISIEEARAGGWTIDADEGRAGPREASRQQIAAMQDEAAAAGDDAMAAICAAALDGDPVAAAEVARCLRQAAAQRDE